MGTRNVTIIKFNGKERVRQYGQWDGYPTAALASIVDFLKTDGAIEKLKRNVVKCRFVSEDVNIFPVESNAISDVYFKHRIFEHDLKKKADMLIAAGGFSSEVIFRYYLATRDTGYQIPNVLIMEEADKASEIVLAKAYTDKIDWQIEAVNVIDLDTEHVISFWHHNMMEWDFNNLPSEEEIDKFEGR